MRKVNNFTLLSICSILFSTASAQTSFYLSCGTFKEMEFKNSFLTTADFGVLHQSNRLFFGIGADVYKFWNDDYSSLGAGIRPLLGYTIIHQKTFHVSIEAKGGMIFMFPEYPQHRVNYNIAIGPYFEWMMDEERKLKLGACYNHFSNGKARSNFQNPTWDGFGLDLTYVFGGLKTK